MIDKLKEEEEITSYSKLTSKHTKMEQLSDKQQMQLTRMSTARIRQQLIKSG